MSGGEGEGGEGFYLAVPKQKTIAASPPRLRCKVQYNVQYIQSMENEVGKMPKGTNFPLEFVVAYN